MYFSETFIPTLKDVKNNYSRGIKLLNKAGMFRGRNINEVFFLPLGCIVIEKLINTLRKQIMPLGFQSISINNPQEFAETISREIKSYKELPLLFYDTYKQNKLGLFVFSEKGDDTEKQVYERISQALSSLLKEYVLLEDEALFFIPQKNGEQKVVTCQCGYKSSWDFARAASDITNEASAEKIQKVETPNTTTIKSLTEFLGIPPEKTLKTLVYVGEKQNEEEAFVVVLRGDRSINENRLKLLLPYENIKIADENTVKKVTGAPTGFAGPLHLRQDVRIYADTEVKTIQNAVTGANQKDYHYINVNVERDIKVDEFLFLREVEKGDICIRCGRELLIQKGLMLNTNTEYSSMLKFTSKQGKITTGQILHIQLDVAQLLEITVSQNSDSEVMKLPKQIVPFDVEVVLIKPEDEAHKKAEKFLRYELQKNNFKVFTDDRKVSPGIKFNDSDLLGIPVKIILGPRSLKNNKGEIRHNLLEPIELKLEEIPGTIKEILEKY